DLLHRWTNGLFRSARHRVVCPQDSDRLSLVLAYDPNPETLIDAADLAFSGSIQEQPITCGDYLDWRFSKAFAYRDTSA
ncbi:MAG: isopenicillin N synthase family oxygenase, partial [Pseudomonadales bacterium]|nr:isopenicillin N synthase family oxygenase [Pseudomonadales bacterium]